MKNNKKSIVVLLGIIVCLVAVIFVFSNSNSKSIVGRWQTESEEEIQFFNNGVYVACDDFGERGTYFIEDGRLQIMPEYDEPIVCDIEIKKDELILYEGNDDYEGLRLYRIK